MAKKPTITSITSGYASTNTLNDNFEALRDAFDNTLSLDGSTPNSMTSDLNLNNNDILNASRILVGGVDYIATALSYKNAAETAKTAAEAAQAAAELVYDNFDDRYLGSKASDPTLDNDGDALLDGALYYDTINTVMKFYDTSTSTWYRTTPTTSDQANIDIVAGNTTNINTVAGISSDVTTVAGISSDVTTVAADGTDIGTVATSISNVNTTATNISNINTVAGISANVTTVAGNTSNINTVATDISNVNTVAGQTTNLQNVTDNLTAIQNAATNATNAATSASNAATSASNASTSETNAASSATAAAASAAAAEASADFFDDVYLGSKASDPSTDNDGDALNAGDLYFNTTSNTMRVYSGSAWQDAAVDSSGFVQTTGGTMTGDLDIQGTLTSDGLTVDATESYINGRLRLESGANSQDLRFSDTSTTDQNSQLRLSSGSLLVQSQNNAFNAATTRASFANNGDISFYEDTGTTAKFFWDASAERLSLGTTSASTELHVKGSGDYAALTLEATTSGGASYVNLGDSADIDVGQLAYFNSDNSMRFTTNATERMRIDSSGNVDIGSNATASAGASKQLLSLVNQSGTAGTAARLWMSGTNATTRGAYIEAEAQSTGNDHDLIFATSASGSTPTERMRIDSSGNLLVGTTDALPVQNNDSNGIALRADGNAQFSRASAATARFNRGTSNGEIISFSYNGTTVGGIQSRADVVTNLILDPRGSFEGVGLTAGSYDATTSLLIPSDGQGVTSDGAMDLGGASNRFKDLYLSGGVYLGGTGSANKLDDYEEGTFTPTFTYGTGITYGSQSGKYIKIGRVVYIEFYLNVTANTNTDASYVHLSSLPFTPDANDTLVTTLNTPECTLLKRSDADSRPSSGGRIVNSADINFCGQGSTYIKYDDCNGSGEFMGAATYYASS